MQVELEDGAESVDEFFESLKENMIVYAELLRLRDQVKRDSFEQHDCIKTNINCLMDD